MTDTQTSSLLSPSTLARLLAALLLSACPGESSDDTTGEPPPPTTATPTTGDTPTTSATSGTTGAEEGTSTGDASTGEASTGGGSGSGGTDDGCVDPAPACTVRDTIPDFCAWVQSIGLGIGFEQVYLDILKDVCLEGDGCATCWRLWSYCSQLAPDTEVCEDLEAECVCVLESFGG